jgi:hypothetical protein
LPEKGCGQFGNEWVLIVCRAIAKPVPTKETVMFSRRDFIKTAAVSTAAASLAEPTAARDGEPWRPLRAEPRKRIIFSRPSPDGRLRLYSDGSPDPRPLILKEALDSAFGRGAGLGLLQPDHWCMIEACWFSGGDLFVPSDPGSWDFAVWRANYHPECEAHDLLAELFGLHLLPYGTRLDDVGLVFVEHPCTPRFATATLDDPSCLPLLGQQVAEKTEWITIHLA